MLLTRSVARPALSAGISVGSERVDSRHSPARMDIQLDADELHDRGSYSCFG
jgi:hypothetical protein